MKKMKQLKMKFQIFKNNSKTNNYNLLIKLQIKFHYSVYNNLLGKYCFSI